MNFWDIVILILIGMALCGAVRLYRGRKKGKCGGCCAACGTVECRCGETKRK